MPTYFNGGNPLITKPFKGKGWDTKMLNHQTFLDYFYRLMELAVNMFEWSEIPDTIDERFIELTLCERGYALYFNDEVMGNLCLPCAIGPKLDVYRIPMYRRAYSVNGYQKQCNEKDSVIIFNNYMHTPSMNTIMLYARRLYEIERTIDVNVKAQKTPVGLLCDEAQRLTIQNLYKQYDGNEPVIIGAKNLDLGSVQAVTTSAPYVSDKLNILKKQIWNEALTFFGIQNSNAEKKERLLTDEVVSNLGGVEAQRYVLLNSRRQAAKQINKMFGTKIEVNFRQDFSALNLDMPTTTTMNTNSDIVNHQINDNGQSFLGG